MICGAALRSRALALVHACNVYREDGRTICNIQHPFTTSACLCQAGAEGDASGAKKLWGGRFTGKTDPLMEKFNESLPFDKRMWEEDIRVRTD
jgi:hypothetical protein